MLQDDSLPPFPASSFEMPDLPCPDGVELWRASGDDLPFLRRLNDMLLRPGFAQLGWAEAQLAPMIAHQFRIRHFHYLRAHPDADFWIVAGADGAPAGRLYVDRSQPRWRLLDIALMPDRRGAGLGGALAAWVQACAVAEGAAGVALLVERGNPGAHRLYTRLGFRDDGDAGPTHQPMLWDAS